MTKRFRVLAGLWAIVLVAAACGGDEGGETGGSPTTEGPAVVDTIGETEGELNLIAWSGYTESGTTKGYEYADWVTPFEDATGCQVTVKYADSSDEMFNLMQQGGAYDGVSASGDSSNRLIAAGAVSAVDPALFPDFASVIPPLQPETGTNNSHYVVDGVVYGTPWMYGPNFLMYNTDEVKPEPTSWDVVFETELDGKPNPYAGSITAYGFPIYIADAAVYLMTHEPDLGITDPYELTEEQLNAAVDLLKGQSTMIDKYWEAFTTEIDGFVGGSMVAGTAWPVNLSYAEADAPVAPVEPTEGMTGWADTWMMSSTAAHPNCMLEWMKYAMTPEVQAETAEFYGAAGSNVDSCPALKKLLDKLYGKGTADLTDTVRYGYCGDASFLDSLYLWRTPVTDCGDDRGTVCQDYSVWSQKWTEIRGA